MNTVKAVCKCVCHLVNSTVNNFLPLIGVSLVTVLAHELYMLSSLTLQPAVTLNLQTSYTASTPEPKGACSRLQSDAETMATISTTYVSATTEGVNV